MPPKKKYVVSVSTLHHVVTGMKCFKSSDIVSSSLLVYDYSLMKSALQITTEKLQERAIKRKIVRFRTPATT